MGDGYRNMIGMIADMAYSKTQSASRSGCLERNGRPCAYVCCNNTFSVHSPVIGPWPTHRSWEGWEALSPARIPTVSLTCEDSTDQQGYDRKIVFEDILKDFQGTVYLVIDSASGNHEHLAYFNIGHSVKAFCHEYLICEIGHLASAFFKECGKVCLEFLLRALYSQPFYFNANPFLAPFILIQFTFLLLPFQIIDTPVFNGGGKERPAVRHILAVFCLDKLEYALRKYLFRTWIIPDITICKGYISDLFLI